MKPSANILAGLYRAGLLGWKDCLILFQSPIMMVFVIVMPLAMVLITGLAFKGFERPPINATVALVGGADNELARRFAELAQGWSESEGQESSAQTGPGSAPGARIHFVRQDGLSWEDAQEQIRSGKLTGAVFLGAAPGEPPIKLLVGPRDDADRFVAESTVERLVYRAQESLHPAAGPATAENWKVVPVEDTGPQGPGFTSFSQAVAGNGALFILLNCIMSGAMGLIRERRLYTLDRLLISPMSRGDIVLGKMLGVYVLGVLQAAVVFGFGIVIGVPMGNLVGVVLVTLVFILVGCALGLTISGLARREENVQLIGSPVGLVMTALGGGMFPVEMAPPWMQRVALIFPTGWAMRAYHALMWDSVSVFNGTVLASLLVLLGFAAVFFSFGVASLRWE